MNHETPHNAKSLGSILADTREELKQFIATRLAMFRAEMRENVAMLKVAAPLAGVALLLLGTAYLLFTLALVGLVLAFLKDNPYRWCFAFLAVGLLWTVMGSIAAYFAKRHFAARKLLPRQTLGVLREDKIWMQSEVRSQI